MNIALTAMTRQSQKLKPSSIPSPMVMAMMRAKAPIVAQLRTRDCDLANALLLACQSNALYPPGGRRTTVEGDDQTQAQAQESA